MRQFGGMIAFELKGGLQAGMRFMDALQLVTRAVSLGDAETLAQHPASMTHSTYTPEERAAHGISDGLVRLSIGLEDIEDVLADIAQALDKAVALVPAVSRAMRPHRAATPRCAVLAEAPRKLQRFRLAQGLTMPMDAQAHGPVCATTTRRKRPSGVQRFRGAGRTATAPSAPATCWMQLARLARAAAVGWQPELATPYVNTIGVDQQAAFPAIWRSKRSWPR